jgi:hypothetical protein
MRGKMNEGKKRKNWGENQRIRRRRRESGG